MENNILENKENIQMEPFEKEVNNPILISIFLIIILGGGMILLFLIYKQSKEPPIVLDEVVQTIELPSSSKPVNSSNTTPNK